MADRLKKLRVVDPVLTSLARGYRNAQFISEGLFPVAELDKESGIIPLFGKEAFRLWETERAIRVHQNLATRPDLPEPEREHALYELGQDFLRAGLLDRAEESLRRLMSGPYAASAKRVLLELYEVEKEWQKAIEAARELKRRAAPDSGDTDGEG